MNAPAQPLLEVRDLTVHYPGRTTWLFRKGPPKKAVDGISFVVPRGKTVGVVGESGSGKSSTGKAIIKLAPLTSGQLVYEGQDIGALSDAAFEAEIFRAGIQAVAKGQREAAQTLGLSSRDTFRFVIFPQAIRTILPALGDQFV